MTRSSSLSARTGCRQCVALCAIDPYDFDTCSSSPCLTGFYGDSPDLTDIYCSGLCTAGHYCEAEATITPTPCPRGTFFPSQGANNASLCAKCFPGQYQPNTGQVACLSCEIGTYSALYGSTECDSCPTGGYCPNAAAGSIALAFTPCTAGRFNSNTGSRSSAECEACAPGWYNARVGSNSSHDCRVCRPGTFSAQEGSDACTSCAAGSYQAASNATACEACDAGDFCPEGASLRLAPTCAAGTFANASEIDGEPECFECGVGFACAGGAARPTACSPGYFANASRSAECMPCDGGTHQPAHNATRCEACERGYFCAAGAAAPQPCPKGSYSNATDLSDKTQCTPCPRVSRHHSLHTRN